MSLKYGRGFNMVRLELLFLWGLSPPLDTWLTSNWSYMSRSCRSHAQWSDVEMPTRCIYLLELDLRLVGVPVFETHHFFLRVLCQGPSF